jgi:hypothetical protein
MSVYVNPLALEAELNYLKTNCNQVVVVASYTVGDTRAIVLGGTNVLASITVTSSDFTISNSGNARVLTSPSAKSDTSADNSGAATQLVFLSSSDVLYVATLTSQAITAGNQVNFPVITYTAGQPT